MTAARNALSIFCALFWCALVWTLLRHRGASLATFLVCALLTWLAIALVQSGAVEEAS